MDIIYNREPDQTKPSAYLTNTTWAQPQHPNLAIQTHTRSLFGTRRVGGIVLIFDDAAAQLEVPESTADVIVAQVEYWMVAKHFSWPAVQHVDIYSSHDSLCAELQLITELYWYGVQNIFLHQILNGNLLSPLCYKPHTIAARLAA